MARTPIDIYKHNKNIRKTVTPNEIIKQHFSDVPEGELSNELDKASSMSYYTDLDFRKKMYEFTKDTVIFGAKNPKPTSNAFAPIANAENKYNTIRPFFYYVENLQNHLRPTQTAQQLVQNAIELDRKMNYSYMTVKANSSAKSMMDTYDNFKSMDSFYAFDLETYSGLGKTGYNELDKIQEIAFRKFNKIDGKVVEDEAGRMETLIGISKQEYDKYYQTFVKDFNEKGWDKVQKNHVMAVRFAKLGHNDTTIEHSGHGIFTTKTFASDESENLMSIDNIKKGLDRALSIGKAQDKERLENGLMVWEDMVLKSHDVFNKNFVVGYNSTNFDIEKLNQQAARIYGHLSPAQQRHYGFVSAPTITPKTNMYMDARDTVRMYAEHYGKTGIYGDNTEKLIKANSIGTLMQQETLGHVLLGEEAFDTAAHTAGADVKVLANLVASSNFETMVDGIGKKASSLTGTIDYNSLLIATQPENFNDFTRKGALNFTSDRLNGAVRTFNGYSLDNDGKVRNLGKFGKAAGIRKNGAYQIGNMSELDMSNEWIKNMQSIHQDYAQGKLWSLTLNPVVDSTVEGSNAIQSDPLYYIFSSKDQMEGFVSSHFAHVGDIEKTANGTILKPLQSTQAQEEVSRMFQRVHYNVDGTVKSVTNSSLNDIVRMSTEKIVNDNAARNVRDMDFNKARKFMKLQEYFESNLGNITNPKDQKTIIEQAISPSAIGTMFEDIRKDLFNVLGYEDINHGTQELWSNTVNNLLGSYDYMHSLKPAISGALGEINSYGDISSKEKQYMFHNFMYNIQRDAAKLLAVNPNDHSEVERIATNSVGLQIFNKDSNFFEFNMPQGFFKQTNNKSVAMDIDNVLRVNLEHNKEFSLVNSLLSRTRGKDPRINKETYGVQALKDFVEAVGTIPGYEHMFDGLSFVNDSSNVIAGLEGQIADINKVIESKQGVLRNLYNQRAKDDEKIMSTPLRTGWTVGAEHERLQKEWSDTFVPEGQWHEWKQAKAGLGDFTPEERSKAEAEISARLSKQNSIMHEQENLKRSVEYLKPSTVTYREGANFDEQINSVYNEIQEEKKKISGIIGEIKGAKSKLREDIKVAKANDPDFLNPEIGTSAMSERIIDRIKAFRHMNPTAGYEGNKVMQDVSKPSMIAKVLTPQLIKESIANTKTSSAEYKTIEHMNKIELNKNIEQIVDKYLMPTVKDGDKLLTDITDIAEYAQRKYGYNKETAKLFKTQLELIRKDHIEGFSKFAKPIYNHGGEIIANEHGLGVSFAGEVMNLFGMPKTVFENGILKHIVGQNEVTSGFFVNTLDAINGSQYNRARTRMTSNLAKGYNNFNYLESHIQRALDTGKDAGKALRNIISRASGDFRELPAIGHNTVKDMFSWQEVDYKSLLTAIPHILDEINSYDGWQDKEMYSIFHKNKEAMLNGVANSDVIEATAKNKQDLLKILFGKTPGRKLQGKDAAEIVLSQMSSYSKDTHLSDQKMLAGEYTPIALGEFDNPSRPVLNQFTNSHIYNKAKLEKEFEGKKHIGAGSRLLTERQSKTWNRHINNFGETEIGIRQITANVSEKNFRQSLADKYSELNAEGKMSSWDRKVYKHMTGYNLTEQGKIIDGRVAEVLMSDTETQIIGSLKNLDRDLMLNNKVMATRYKNAMPVVEIAKNGVASVKLQPTQYVKHNDPLLAITGYADSTKVIGVKETAGHFGFGYTLKNTDHLLSEGEINKFLADHAGELNTEDDVRRLLDKNFNSVYYVKNSALKGYNKIIFEGAEKGMAEALLAGAGTLDSRVNKLLSITGHEELQNRILSKRFIHDELLPSYSRLGENEKQTVKDIFGITNNDNVKDVLLRAINKEKYAPSDFLKTMKGFEDVTTISVDNVGKHGNSGMAVRQMLQSIAYKFEKEGLSTDEAYKKTFDLAREHDVFNGMSMKFENGTIKFGNVDSLKANINYEGVEAMAKAVGLYDESSELAIKGKDGSLLGRKNVTIMTTSHDFSGVSRSNAEVGQIKSKLKALRENPTENAEEIQNLQLRLNAAMQTNKSMKISSRETNMLGLYSYDDKFIDSAKGKFSEQMFKENFGHMVDENGNLKAEFKGRKIHQDFLDQVYSKAKINLEANKENINNSFDALKFNGGDKSSFEYLVNKKGFEVAHIDDLETAIGTNNLFLRDNPNKAFGRNLMIKTGLTGEDSFVAVSRLEQSVTKDTINSDEVQKAISRMKLAKTAWEDGKRGLKPERQTIEKLENNYRGAIEQLRGAVDKEARNILANAKSVRFENSSYEKATMAMFERDGGLKNYHMFNTSKVGDKTIGELANEGVHVSASWHSTDYFKELGYFDEDKLKALNMTKDDMIKHLSENGTIGLELRTPTIKEGSAVTVKQYLDTGLKAGMTKATAPVVVRRNQDHDGDSVLQMELRHEATGSSYADYQIRKAKGIATADESKYFDNINASVMHDSITLNPKAFKQLEKSYNEKDVNMAEEAGVATKVLANKQNAYGHITAYSQTEADSEMRNNFKAKYTEMEDDLIEKIGKDKYHAMDQIERAKAFDSHIASNELDESYSQAVKFMEIHEKDMGVLMSKSSKGSIGYINTPLASLRRIVPAAENLNSTHAQVIQAIADVSEESMISRKHSAATAISLTQGLRENVEAMTRGGQGGLEAANSINSMLTNDFGQEVVDKLKTFSKIDGIENMSNEDALNLVHSTITDTAKAFDGNANLRNLYVAENAERNLSRKNVRVVEQGISRKSDGLNKVVAEVIEDKADNFQAKRVESSHFEAKGLRNAAREVVEEIGHGFSGNGGVIAKAAVGLAASVMMAGYIGGNPTTPADNQAETVSNQYDSLQDKDLSIQSLPPQGGTGQGYVININAQSKKGREHAMEAIQKAMQSSIPTDVNVSMNIGDKTSNINSRFIDKLLSGAL